MQNVNVFLVNNWQVILVIWGACLLLCTHIGMRRGFPVMGFINGLLMGPLGLLNVLTTGDLTRRACPHCAEDIKKHASICPYCQRAVSPG